MKLLTKVNTEELPRLYATENEEDPIAHVKIFNPYGIGTWYLTEYDPDTKEAFGLVNLHEVELGYISMQELEDLRVTQWNFPLERDKSFKPTRISEIKASL